MKHLEAKYKEHIAEVLLNGFEKELLDTSFVNLSHEGALRFNNFAYALRELMRHLLHRLAPGNEVKACAWFKPDPTSKTGITRKHRIKYAIQGGLSDWYVEKELFVTDVDDVSDELVKIISLLSEFTHIEEHTFNLDNSIVKNNAEQCLEATIRFIQLINETRSEVISALPDNIDKVLIERIINESVEDVMELSTHQFIEDIRSDEVSVENIGPKSLELRVFGSLDCELQYGSGSDMRRGDGAVINETFPIDALISVKFIAPLGSSMDVNHLKVDTSSWSE